MLKEAKIRSGDRTTYIVIQLKKSNDSFVVVISLMEQGSNNLIDEKSFFSREDAEEFFLDRVNGFAYYCPLPDEKGIML